jgi:hypothetical protein
MLSVLASLDRLVYLHDCIRSRNPSINSNAFCISIIVTCNGKFWTALPGAELKADSDLKLEVKAMLEYWKHLHMYPPWQGYIPYDTFSSADELCYNSMYNILQEENDIDAIVSFAKKMLAQ